MVSMENTNRPELTESEQSVLLAARLFIDGNGYPPTVRDLCKLTGYSSPSTVHIKLKALESKGYIEISPRGKRALKIIKDAAPVGKWIVSKNLGGYEDAMCCSMCGFIFDNWSGIFSYCPICGSPMQQ